MATHSTGPQILHQPRLDTILMVEKTIRKMKVYPNKRQLWKALPKKVMYQTFNVILDYLEKSGKILITKDKKIMWTWDPKTVKRLKEQRLIVR
ncbi:hypothetical protein GF374_01370 [Candidatus Woesearchaeota archaeon]|nr:hypothetical protein [Candidatus Woesearchaeota archaeon]